MPAARPSGPVRRLAHFAKPQPGESFASWIDRGAAETDLQRRVAWVRLGLTPNSQTNPGAYGVDLSPAAMQNLHMSTGLSPTDLSPMLLRSFDGYALSLKEFDMTRPDRVRVWARSAWVFMRLSHACPECIQDSNGVWQLAWKLPWSFVCLRHHRYLISTCPGCGERLQSNELDRRQQLICCSSTPNLTRGRFDGAPRRRRHRDDICGHPIGDAVSSAAGAEAVALQAWISGLLTPNPAKATDGLQAVGSLAEIRALIPLVLHLGTGDLIERCDSAVRDRFGEHVSERDNDVPRRGPQAVAKYRKYALAPSDPLLMAGALDVAARLSRSSDLSEDWAWFVDTVTAASPAITLRMRQLKGFWVPPAKHAKALRRASDHHLFAVSAALDGRARHAQPAHVGLDSRHVPALLWPKAYEQLAPGLIEPGSTVAGRRFLSLALARTLEPSLSSWRAAARALGLSVSNFSYCNKLSSRCRQLGTGALLERRLSTLGEALADQQDRIDYSARRSHFHDLHDLTPQDWSQVCEKVAVNPNGRYWAPRRRQAAAWLWEVLTGGDWHDAPGLGLRELPQRRRAIVSGAYVSYFRAQHLQGIEEPLVSLGRTLLERRGLPGPVSVDIAVPSARLVG